MAKMKKIITAGPLVKEVVYPIVYSHDTPRVRAGKRRVSSEAQQRMNLIYSWQKLEFMLAANYLPGDLVIVLTYDDTHLPQSRAEAAAKLKYFRAKLAAARRSRSKDLVMFWNEEHLHQSADHLENKRWHHHIVVNSTGNDYEELSKAWGQGKVLVGKLRVDKEKNYETLARYMCKEARDKPGQRSWSYTRTAKKPEVESFRVPDDTTVAAPKGSTLLEEDSSRTEFGSYRYIKYLAAGWETTKISPRRRAKRRRRRARS